MDYLAVAKDRLTVSRKELTEYSAQQAIAAALIALVERLDDLTSQGGILVDIPALDKVITPEDYDPLGDGIIHSRIRIDG